MIALNGTNFMIEKLTELPEVPEGCDLFLDCETRGPDPFTAGNQPYKGDRACGWAVTWDDNPLRYYVPIRHRDPHKGKNLDVERVNAWLARTLKVAGRWINHNLKFDKHFAFVDRARYHGPLVDTMVMAKIVNSDRMSHALKPLLRDWLDVDQTSEDEVSGFLRRMRMPRGKRARDYALVPPDVLGTYACDGVGNNRLLYHWLERKLPEQCRGIWETEQKLTPVLWDMENDGVRVNPQQLKIEKVKSLHKMLQLGDRLTAFTEMEFVDSINFASEVIVGRLGLPILSRDRRTKRPSFDADALKLYLTHPEVLHDADKLEFFKALMAYREEQTYCSLFVDAFLDKMDDACRVHTDYNQVVRTGRMSSRNPNLTQQSARAKQLLWPDEGHAFWEADAAQIEFRVIAHYIKDPDLLKAYEDDPRTDFHNWVSELCEMSRSPSKTMNFCMGYGAGVRRTEETLASNMEIIDAVNAQLDANDVPDAKRMNAFKAMITARVKQIRETYHDRLPGIRDKTHLAEEVCKQRGYVFNAFGRRRHLPPNAAYKSFNTLCQGTAMDVVKRRMIEVAPLGPRHGGSLKANVHDSVLFSVPKDEMPALEREAMRILEVRDPELRVPIVWDPTRGDTDRPWKSQ